MRDIFVDPKKKVVSLRKRAYRLEIGSFELSDFLKRHPRAVRFSVPALILLLVFLNFRYVTRAEMAVFYPESCLGGWSNPQNAQGAPDVSSNSDSSSFTPENSAVLGNSMSQIYCGGFKGEIPPNTTPLKVNLKLSWTIKDKAEAEETAVHASSTEALASTTDEITGTGTSTAQHAPAPAISGENAATSSAESTDESETLKATSSVDSSSVSAPSPSPEPVPAPPAPATEPAAESAPETTPVAPAPAPAASEPAVEPVSFLSHFIPFAYAEELASSTAAQSAVSTNTAATATLEAAEIPPATSSLATSSQTAAVIDALGDRPEASGTDLFEVFYTLDGTEWHSLGKVTKTSASDAVFEIPVEAGSEWKDIANLQVRVQSLLTADTYITYLDGMRIETEYQNEHEMTPEELEAYLNDLPNRPLHITLVSPDIPASGAASTTASTTKAVENGLSATVFTQDGREKLGLKTTTSGTITIYGAGAAELSYTSAIGDDKMEIPAYFFRPGRYIIFYTKMNDSCAQKSADECRAAGIKGERGFIIEDPSLK